MPEIKRGKWNEINASTSSLRQELQKRLDEKNLPREIVAEVRSLIKKIDSLDPAKANISTKLSGKILTLDEVRDIAEDCTGYKWNASKWGGKDESPFDRDLKESVEDIADRYGVAITVKDVAGCVLDRRARSRDELDTLEVICMPGHVFLLWNTGRACGDSQAIMPNEGLRKFLGKL